MDLTLQLWQWVILIVSMNLAYMASTDIKDYFAFRSRIKRFIKSVGMRKRIKIHISILDYSAFIDNGKKRMEDELMEYIEKEVRYDLFCSSCENGKLDDKGNIKEACESCQGEPVNINSRKPVYYKEVK